MSHNPLAIVTAGMLAPAGGSVTYLAGGAEIDIAANPAALNIATDENLSVERSGKNIDLRAGPLTLDMVNDGNSIDL